MRKYYWCVHSLFIYVHCWLPTVDENPRWRAPRRPESNRCDPKTNDSSHSKDTPVSSIKITMLHKSELWGRCGKKKCVYRCCRCKQSLTWRVVNVKKMSYLLTPCLIFSNIDVFHIDVPRCFILSCLSSLILIVPFVLTVIQVLGPHKVLFQEKKLKIMNIWRLEFLKLDLVWYNSAHQTLKQHYFCFLCTVTYQRWRFSTSNFCKTKQKRSRSRFDLTDYWQSLSYCQSMTSFTGKMFSFFPKEFSWINVNRLFASVWQFPFSKSR